MRVLLSIKPEYADKIFAGTKKYEFRKALFKRSDIKSVVVYASAPRQEVIGEFAIADVLTDRVEEIWSKTCEFSGISKQFYDAYFANREFANAICVGRIHRYKNPKKLQDFSVSCPPQSFAYIN